MDKDIQDEIAKIKYHVRQLAESLDCDDESVASLVIPFDWSEQDFRKVNDIFEKYDKDIEHNKPMHHGDLEREFKAHFNLSYQDVKPIILHFWHNSRWIQVCKWYVMDQKPSIPLEFQEIAEHIRNAEAKKSASKTKRSKQ